MREAPVGVAAIPRLAVNEAKRTQTAFILPKPTGPGAGANFANLQVMFPNQMAESAKVRLGADYFIFFLACTCQCPDSVFTMTCRCMFLP